MLIENKNDGKWISKTSIFGLGFMISWTIQYISRRVLRSRTKIDIKTKMRTENKDEVGILSCTENVSLLLVRAFSVVSLLSGSVKDIREYILVRELENLYKKKGNAN